MLAKPSDSFLDTDQIPLPSPHTLDLANPSQKSFECSQCNLKFALISDLQLHRSISEKIVMCQVCLKGFSSELGMKKHYGKLHINYKPSRCQVCRKKFRNKYAMKRHVMQVHGSSSRVQCEDCGKSLFNSYSLERHKSVCRLVEEV